MVKVGFRVYLDPETKGYFKKDDRGIYKGYSETYDEWLPLYSPKVAIFESKTVNADKKEDEVIDDYDDMWQPEEGYTRVYVVPR